MEIEYHLVHLIGSANLGSLLALASFVWGVLFKGLLMHGRITFQGPL